jgi:predicted SprT family Zn-dependent metalloprotease
MALTVGAIILLLGLMFLIYYGYTVGVKRSAKSEKEDVVKCSLCTQKYARSRVVERVGGESKLYYFCEECIDSLGREIKSDA